MSKNSLKEKMEDERFEVEPFCITEDDMKKKFGVTNTDDPDEIRKKIYAVVTQTDYLYKLYNKDPLEWTISKITIGAWTVPIKEEKLLSYDEIKGLGFNDKDIKPTKISTPAKTRQQKFSVEFKTRDKKELPTVEAARRLEEIIKNPALELSKLSIIESALNAKKYEMNLMNKPPVLAYDKDKVLVVPDVELHLGKLSSFFDSNDAYNYKKALYRYIHSIQETCKIQELYRPSTVIVSIGQDFHNSDTATDIATTTKGTQQINDSRYQKIIMTSLMSHKWTIEKLKEKCEKVIVVLQAGNHDQLMSAAVYSALKMIYANDPKVEIKTRPEDYRLATYEITGNTMAVFFHGQASNPDKMVEMVETYFHEEIKKVDNVIIYPGHVHVNSQNNYSKRKSYNSHMTVCVSGCPAGEGAWEAENGYQTDKTTNVYIQDVNKGLYATFNFKLSNEELEKGVKMPSDEPGLDLYDILQSGIDNNDRELQIEELEKTKSKLQDQYKDSQKQWESIITKLAKLYKQKKPTKEELRKSLLALGFPESVKDIDEAIKVIDQKIMLLKKEEVC